MLFFILDFELQVSIVECLYRLTTDSERVTLAKNWFSSHSTAIENFIAIREAEFEVVSVFSID